MNTRMNNRLLRSGCSGLVGVAWALLCIVLFVGMEGKPDGVAATLFCLYLFASIMLWRAALDNRVSPLALMFWIFHANFLFLPALSQVLHRNFFWSAYASYAQKDLYLACAVIVAGLLAFLGGAALARKKPVAPATEGDAERQLLFRSLRATWVVQLFLVLVLLALAGVVANLGVEFFITLRQDRSDLQTQALTGLLVNLPRAAAVAVLLFSTCILVQRWRRERRVQVPMLLIFAAALGLNAIINYPLGLARFWFFGLVISLLWIVKPLDSVKLRSAFVLAATALQCTLFPWFSQITRGTGLLGFDLQAIRQYLHHGDFDGFQSIVNSLIYIRESGFEHGRSLLSVVLFFLPRSMWDKADTLGSAAAAHMGYRFTNLSAPIYGEFYADFGLISLLLGMGLVGYALKRLDGCYDLMIRERRQGAGLLLIGVLSGYLAILLRGSLLAVISGIAVLLLVLLCSIWLAGRSHPRTHLNIRPSRHKRSHKVKYDPGYLAKH